MIDARSKEVGQVQMSQVQPHVVGPAWASYLPEVWSPLC